MNNTVTNTTVTGFRDIGGIAGCLSVMSGNTFTGNNVIDITVTQSKTNEYSTFDVKKKTVDTILGRIMQGDTIDSSNTATGNNNVTVQYDTEVRNVGYRVD